ncbi:MAG: dynamin family protein [Campylobacter sp.]|nr:dynamin family protein [Campylobacter sp.]
MQEFLNKFWGKDALFLDEKFILTASEDKLGVLLATNAENIDRFMSLPEYKDILYSLNLHSNLHSVQQAQVGTINALLQAKISKEKILKSLEILQNENIISDFSDLKDFIDSLNTQNFTQTQPTKSKFFQQEKEKLFTLFDEIFKLADDENLKTRLKNAKQKIKDLKFNIVVTGVINSGKSTLLNALLDKKILGSSNVPETTNLSILKFAPTAYARVNFWSENELKNLGINKDELTKSKANEILATSSNLINSDQNLSQNIDINALKNYTSASSPFSKFVKSIQLYENLEILKDGIDIIDTPGIDDAVVLREKLVQDFMSECDMMVHLMNISQSATKKDIDFIKRSIATSHISSLVIVLTHADLLGAGETNEVLNYTKKSIQEKANFTGAKYFTLSCKSYFDGKKDSGVEDFKDFLYESFFGQNNQKSKLAVLGFKREIASVCDEMLRQSRQNLLNLFGENSNHAKDFDTLKEQENLIKNELDLINKNVQSELANIDITRLDADFKANLKILQIKLNERLDAVIKYNKSTKSIVQTTLNDGILGLFRQNRNEILKQLSTIASNLTLKFGGFENLGLENVFSLNEYLAKNDIKLDFTKIADDIDKNPSQRQKIASEFLQNEWIKNLVLDLVESQKNEFLKQIQSICDKKVSAFDEKLKALENEILSLNSQNKNLNEQIASLKSRQNSLNTIKSELENA